MASATSSTCNKIYGDVAAFITSDTFRQCVPANPGGGSGGGSGSGDGSGGDGDGGGSGGSGGGGGSGSGG